MRQRYVQYGDAAASERTKTSDFVSAERREDPASLALVLA